jgi:DNA modification methylase
MLLAGCPPGGSVVDPFVGAGTTMVVAEDLGCAGIGIDLNPTYLELARRRILEARAKRLEGRRKVSRSPGTRGNDF